MNDNVVGYQDDDDTAPEVELAATLPEIKAETSSSEAAAISAAKIYLHEISAFPLLTAAEEVALTKQMHAGSKIARYRMINSNLRLVVKIASHYLSSGMELMDLVAEGNLGLLHAIKKFNPDLGFRFSTYATRWIRQAIERAIMNQSRTIRLPIHVAQKVQAQRKQVRALEKSLQHEPTIRELAAFTNKTAEDVEQMKGLEHTAVSLDTPIPENEKGTTFAEIIADPNNIDPSEQIYQETITQLIAQWLHKLNTVQREIIERRFGLYGYTKATLAETSKAMRLSREKIRRIQIIALSKLRNILRSYGISQDIINL